MLTSDKQRTPKEKAQSINDDFSKCVRRGLDPAEKPNFRGTIAEIGAGQEVARHLFEAFNTANTVVKTMSAYSKTCSRVIYSPNSQPSESFVTRKRLIEMLDHEYALLVERGLDDDRYAADMNGGRRDLRYFAFANSIALDRDGWTGIRVQQAGSADDNDGSACEVVDYYIHFNILGQDKLDKIRVVGALGISLIYGAFLNVSSLEDMPDSTLVRSLMDGYDPSGIRIDSMEVRTLQLKISENEDDPKQDFLVEHITPEGKNALDNERSRNFGVELVKCSAVRAASFVNPFGPPSISYHTTGETSDGSGLLLTRSTMGGENIRIENELLLAAKEVMIGARRDSGLNTKVRTGVQVPILTANDTKKLAERLKLRAPEQSELHSPIVLVGDRDVPTAYTKERRSLLDSEPKTDEVARLIDGITEHGHLAILTEFFAVSELAKFVRNKTRLSTSRSNHNDFGLVFRIDQLLAGLCVLKNNVKNRTPMEVLDSLVRRVATVYLYPCTARQLLRAKSPFGDEVAGCLRAGVGEELNSDPNRSIELSDLTNPQFCKFGSLMTYLHQEDGKRFLRQVPVRTDGDDITDVAIEEYSLDFKQD